MVSLPVSPSAFNALSLLAEDVHLTKALVVERLIAASIITLYFGPKTETARSRAARFDCLYPDGFRHLIDGKLGKLFTNENENESPLHDSA